MYDRGMALARLVVIEGPDLGQEFEIPLRGGGIGRGEGNVVQKWLGPVTREQFLSGFGMVLQ